MTKAASRMTLPVQPRLRAGGEHPPEDAGHPAGEGLHLAQTPRPHPCPETEEVSIWGLEAFFPTVQKL